MAEDLAGITAVSRNRTLLNAGAAYFSAATTMGVGFVLQAYLVRTLGREQYALWPLIGSCTAVIALLPRGIGAGVGRFLAHALGADRPEEVEAITSSVFFGLLGGALLYTLAVIGVSVGFEWLFDVPPGARGIGPPTMLLAGLAGAVLVPFSVFQGGLVAAQRFGLTGLVSGLLALLKLGAIALAFTLGAPSLVWVAAITLGLAGVEAASLFVLARRALPWQRLRWRSVNWSLLARVSNFSFWVFVSSVAGLLYWHTDNFLINKLLDPTLVTGYSVVVSISTTAYQVVSLGCGVLTPALTVMHAQGDHARIERVIYRANRTVLPPGSLPLLAVMFFGGEVLALYVGEAYRSYGTLFWIAGAAMLLSSAHRVNSSVAIAFGQMKLASIGALAAAVLNVVLSLIFVQVLHWGLLGVAGGTLASWVVYKMLFWTWLVARMLGVPARRVFWRSTAFPLLLTLPGAAVLAAAWFAGLGHGLLQLAAIGLVSALVQGSWMLLYGLEPADRAAARALPARLVARVQARLRQG